MTQSTERDAADNLLRDTRCGFVRYVSLSHDYAVISRAKKPLASFPERFDAVLADYLSVCYASYIVKKKLFAVNSSHTSEHTPRFPSDYPETRNQPKR